MKAGSSAESSARSVPGACSATTAGEVRRQSGTARLEHGRARRFVVAGGAVFDRRRCADGVDGRAESHHGDDQSVRCRRSTTRLDHRHGQEFTAGWRSRCRRFEGMSVKLEYSDQLERDKPAPDTIPALRRDESPEAVEAPAGARGVGAPGAPGAPGHPGDRTRRACRRHRGATGARGAGPAGAQGRAGNQTTLPNTFNQRTKSWATASR